MEQPATVFCPGCAAQVPADLLACPVCKRLVYAQRLGELAAQATAAAARADGETAMQSWREALDLLPPDSRQYAAIVERLAALSSAPPAGPLKPASTTRPAVRGERSRFGKFGVAAAGLGALLWKLKFAVAFIITKGKFLLLGLTKSSTFFSMFLSFGVYWNVWGWPFALGLVLSIYVHEMGHVAALRRYGIKATAPMFIPGLGAVVRFKQHRVSAAEDASIALAGPLWGLMAAALAFGVWRATGKPIWGAIAHGGAWLNLFNLLPIWQLDGGRGFSALSRRQGFGLALVVAAMWFYTAEGLLIALLILMLAQASAKPADIRDDKPALLLFVFLIVTLSLLCKVQVIRGFGG